MIDVYRKISGVETQVCSISDKNAKYPTAIMGIDEVQISVVVDSVLDIEQGDYIKMGAVHYKLNRDAEYTIKSGIEYDYDLVFEHPLYTLLDKLYTYQLTGSAIFTLTGKLVDFVNLLVWNINYNATNNPLGVDSGWSVGSVVDTDYKNIVFSAASCRDVLTLLSTTFNAEFSLNNKQINYVDRIENETDFVFVQGQGNGLYEVSQRNVDTNDTITRVYPVGGNKNVPNTNADEDGNLKLPELYLENFTDYSRVVEKRVVFEDVFPHFIGTIGSVSGTNNIEMICSAIDFDLNEIAVGDNARVNFLTGDLMGVAFQFQWDNTLKKITLIEQNDETALTNEDGTKQQVPRALKKAVTGDKFNFTGVIMPASYVNAAITSLRAKATSWLEFYSRKRVAFDIAIDYRWMRGKAELKPGDMVTITIPQKNLTKILRVTGIDKNLKTGEISATVSNYLDEKWEKKIEGQISSLQTTVQSGLIGSGNVDILERYDARPASDRNVMSSLRSQKNFLRKDIEDTAAERITFDKGAVVRDLATKDFVQGKFAGAGAGIYDDEQGNSVIEVDKLNVRKEAWFNEIIINQIRFQGGIVVYSAANLEALSVVDGGSYLQVHFDTKNGQVTNQFAIDDQIRCQRFSGGSVIKYYMSRVTSLGADYIRLSKTDIDGTLNVEVGDAIVQFGNRTNTARQALIEVNVLDGGKQTFYQNVNSYSLTDKNYLELGRLEVDGVWRNMIRSYGGAYIGNRALSSYIKYDEATGKVEIKADVKFLAAGGGYVSVEEGISSAQAAAITAASADATAKANAAQAAAYASSQTYVNSIKADLQNQIDGSITSWFNDYEPTLLNQPVIGWDATAKIAHLGDLFYWTSKGYAYRFMSGSGGYSWGRISDTDVTKALADAAKAQDTANGKRTTFAVQPTTPYLVGDFWLNNGDLYSCNVARATGSFVAGDWSKGVKYTDDTAVDNLQIGGRNLLNDSNGLTGWGVNAGTGTYALSNGKILLTAQTNDCWFWRSLGFKVGNEYTLSFDLYGTTPISVNIAYQLSETFNAASDTIPLRVKKTFKLNSAANDVAYFVIPSTGFNNRITNVQLENGSKATDYKPSTEDVAISIADAKTAGTNAQNTANAANTAASNLADFSNTAFADGVIDRAEATAIAKYTNTVNTGFDSAISGYTVVYDNSYLTGTPKTDLLNAKVTLAGAKGDLITSINTAISDGKTTSAEKAYVDAKYALYKSAFTSYTTALENANKAIQTKLDSLSTDKVNSIQIGGANLLNNSKLITFTGVDSWSSVLLKGSHSGTAISPSPYLINGKQYVFSAKKIAKTTGTSEIVTLRINDYVNSAGSNVGYLDFSQNTQSLVFTVPATGYWTLDFYTGNAGSTFGSGSMEFVQLELGNKPTDYTPSTEDTDAKILEAKNLATALDYLKAAIGGTTEINGGLALGNILGVKDQSGVVKAGMNGIDDPLNPNDIRLWSGATIADMINANWSVDETGFMKAFAGLIGDFLIKLGAIIGAVDGVEKIKLHTGLLPTISEMDNATWQVSALNYLANDAYAGKVYDNSDYGGGVNDLVTFTITRSLTLQQTTLVRFRSSGVTINDASGGGNVESVSEVFNVVGVNSNIVPTVAGVTQTLAAGTYTIMYSVDIYCTPTPHQTNQYTLRLTNSNVYIDLQQGVGRTEIGRNGLLSYFGSANYFYYSQLLGLKYRGVIDIPAGLGGASINGSGTVGSNWGKIAGTGQVVKSGSNYTITHNIGDTDYSLILTPISGNVPYYSSKAANTIVVTCAGGFDFVLIRTK